MTRLLERINNKLEKNKIRKIMIYIALLILVVINTRLIFCLNLEWKMLVVSIISLIINAVMLIVAIQGIVIPLQKKRKEERDKSKKAISIVNSIIEDKKIRLNIIYMALNIYKIKPFKERKVKTFINDNLDVMAFTISYLENNNFIEKIQDVRNEYSNFLYSRFEMLEDSDIENIKKRIKEIDSLLFETYQIYKLVPEDIRKNQSIYKVQNYLEKGINVYFNGEDYKKEYYWIGSALQTFSKFEEYKKKIKGIDQAL